MIASQKLDLFKSNEKKEKWTIKDPVKLNCYNRLKRILKEFLSPDAPTTQLSTPRPQKSDRQGAMRCATSISCSTHSHLRSTSILYSTHSPLRSISILCSTHSHPRSISILQSFHRSVRVAYFSNFRTTFWFALMNRIQHSQNSFPGTCGDNYS